MYTIGFLLPGAKVPLSNSHFFQTSYASFLFLPRVHLFAREIVSHRNVDRDQQLFTDINWNGVYNMQDMKEKVLLLRAYS